MHKVKDRLRAVFCYQHLRFTGRGVQRDVETAEMRLSVVGIFAFCISMIRRAIRGSHGNRKISASQENPQGCTTRIRYFAGETDAPLKDFHSGPNRRITLVTLAGSGANSPLGSVSSLTFSSTDRSSCSCLC